MSDEKLISGRLFYTECKRSRYGVRVVSRSEIGQGWGMDLENISPQDLRALADFIDQRMKKEDQE